MKWTMFYNVTDLYSIEIPNSVNLIPPLYLTECSMVSVSPDNKYYDSRNNCNAIIATSTNSLIVGSKNTVIPNSVTNIGSQAFNNCTGLTSITIPNSVIEIYGNAFNNCSNLETITSLATTAPAIDDSTFRNVKTNGTLTVPSGSSG